MGSNSMKPPKSGYGKEYAVKWVGNEGETMYSGAMTKEEAERVAAHGHWHRNAFPSIEKLKLGLDFSGEAK